MKEEVIQNFKSKKISNKTSIYLLPMIGSVYNDFVSNSFPKSNYISCYLKDATLPDDDKVNNSEKILIQYKFSGDLNFIEFEKKLMSNENFEFYYEIDKYHTMYVFKIPELWISDYNKFKEWKPSSFSQEYKNKVKFFYKLTNDHIICKVLNKDESLFKQLDDTVGEKVPRNLEASSFPYFEEIEYFREEFKYKEAMKLLRNSFESETNN